MPWQPSDAKSHTKKADTPKLQRMWRDVANAALKRHGDEGRAVKEANGVIAKEAKKRKGRR